MSEDKFFSKNSKRFLTFLFLCLFLIFSFNFLGIKKNSEEFLFFLVKPINSVAYSSSQSVKNFFQVFEEVRTLRSDYYELQEKYLKLKSRNNLLPLLEEENSVLKKQLNVADDGVDLILADVLFQDLTLKNESLLTNRGRNDGVEWGDIALIGDTYIGFVSEVFDYTSKVRLPTSRASSIKVMILSSEFDFENETFQPRDFLSGVAYGQANILTIDNIEMRGDLNEGDIIFTNDERIGEHLFMGKVLSIDEDPTATLRSCTVDIPIEYSNLKRIFIKKGE